MNCFEYSEAKVFGHIYMVVFSNGVVKAGMSARGVESRISSHKNVGEAFGISAVSSHIALIYAADTKARESIMLKEISKVAKIVSGREWFKFNSCAEAEAFAKNYLGKVERMSLAEKPAKRDLLADQELFVRNLDALFYPEIAKRYNEMVGELKALKPNIAVALATKLIAYTDNLYINGGTIKTKVPMLTGAIDLKFKSDEAAIKKYFHDLELSEDYDNEDACDPVKVDTELSPAQAVSLLCTAAHYPEFLCESLLWSSAQPSVQQSKRQPKITTTYVTK